MWTLNDAGMFLPSKWHILRCSAIAKSCQQTIADMHRDICI